MKNYPTTPDGRYFVVKERLWRCQNPKLSEQEASSLKSALGKARARVKNAEPGSADMKAARAQVNKVKILLGERGPVWWNDGAPDENRKHPKNTRYATWWASINNKL